MIHKYLRSILTSVRRFAAEPDKNRFQKYTREDGTVVSQTQMWPKVYFRYYKIKQKIATVKTRGRRRDMMYIKKSVFKPPPDGWGIVEFLKSIPNINFEEGQAEEYAKQFKDWKDFITTLKFSRDGLGDPPKKGKDDKLRLIKGYIKLFNHGLWPKSDKIQEQFKGTPLKNSHKPWTEETTNELLEWADYYDVNFGDPWIYISWKMQRPMDEIRNRYLLIALENKKKHKWEFGLTKCTRPLLMSRKFNISPPFLHIIPSSLNTDIEDGLLDLPEPFLQYRDPNIF
eukprot:GHVL01038872.1.p1 GENE.GHVL01038872.1~~GHVL01038872.1.p1  ORF type:complete len:285 (-),score=47.74 GHVL01038872.1:45-899(-)